MAGKGGFFESLLSGILGDSQRPDADRPELGVPMLADWLPYRSFDAKTGVFYNSASRGFVIEAAPLIGADERTGEILTQFLSEAIPAPGCLQFHQWMSPRVSERLSRWYLPRYSARGVYERMAKHRIDFLTDGVWRSLSADAPFSLRNHRVAISYSTPESSSVSVEEIVAVMDGLISALASINVPARKMDPTDLIGWIDDITSPTTAAGEDVVNYNPLDPIADQAVRRDVELHIEPDRMLLRTERFRPTGATVDEAPEIGEILPDVFDVRSFSVRNLPSRWAPWDVARLIGDMFTDKLRMPCPVATNLCVEFPDPLASSNKASFKFMRTTSLADSKSARFLPQLREQSQEWRYVNDELRQGRKLVRVFFSVTSFSPKGRGDANERVLKSVYRAAGWDLLDDRYLQVMGLLCAMPMTMANGLARDLERMKRMRTLLTTTAANLAPIQGEYLGGQVPHLMLIGRRGQPFFWSPFENAAGNHNVAVFGKSGSGKSVTLQELCASLCGAGARVVVIDDGRSFEHSAKLQGGAFVEFTMSSGFCLNPFSMIDEELARSDEDYLLDCMAMLKAIVNQMSRHIDRLNDTERGLIDGAVNSVWSEKGRQGSIDDVIAALEATGNGLAMDLGIAMRPFSSAGTYGRFFQGEVSFELSAQLTVFELSDLSSREELRSVVLTAIMFMSQQMMRKVDRSVPKALLLDEAWQMLRGGAMADFIETYARTCRKYGAALVTATQSLNDYYKSAGSVAALENSDWFVILQQKPETIADFKKHDRFEMDDYTDALLRSLKINGREYSDILIKGPETLAVGRLVLDPFSATVYSSSPAIYAAIEALVARGLSMDEAIERVAFPGNPEKWASHEQVDVAEAAE
ncbi:MULTISPECIES: type IV secretion system protein TraC [Sphingomonadales]|jgi:conjugal transfer ATP-binding protein TraC|uniref:Type-IV secretion system protein TraC n=5 Tax=Sphingomonadaceae TaxID=41297 RepID=A0A1E1F8B5_9SPHN|nr:MULTISPECIES: type IV secretion system protein TraC [Sphingomonadaceae]EPR17158.1 (4Fe-4S)-binding protein [Sphingobium indicum IP26]EZP70278.1 (4Fe-4S)-binding protein [Sphingomonas paucimobilis]MBW7950197.1 type IV secretion system protein TraC [Pseudorhodoplanes sp.]AMK20557.1 Type-IV secretion system protein TraC [Sphingobium sp. MI1205]AMK21337.1 Type-IV secretion system protein TraC [Sphingobium sp. TKS]